jgi:CxxC motif-containing protein (DUF1111 family)
LEKVSDTSFPRLPVFGGTLQDIFRSDFSPRGKISITLPENSYFQQQSFSHGSTILSSWKPKKLGYGNKHPKGPVWWSTYLEEYKL